MKHSIYLISTFLPLGCGGDFSTGFSPLETLENDSGTGSVQGSGGQPHTGGSPATGGAPDATGGVVGTGGAPDTGGTSNTGGVVVATGGAPVDAGCTLVTHDNGLGGVWKDCVPLGTYNEEQAMKACEASDAVSCTVSPGCGGGDVVIGRGDPTDVIVGAWGYGGNIDSHVCGGPTCSGCPNSGSWN